MIKEALLYEKAPKRAAHCRICRHTCLIQDGELGRCRTRLNWRGRLYSLTYGEVSSWRRAPIEIKPVYHYLPGSFAYSLGSVGCNFLCPGCQNWEISFARSDPIPVTTSYLAPMEAVQQAERLGCQGLSWTYNEPTLWFEYTLECARLAKDKGFYTSYVTNGFMTIEALDVIGPYLDVFRVDIKGFSEKTYHQIANTRRWKGILDTTVRAKTHWNMHVEVVTNIIPGYNDDPEELLGLSQWIRDSLGAGTPWHLTRFYPHWRLSHIPPTSVRAMERIRDTALSNGLHFVYLGNVWKHPANNTFCPNCRKKLIERTNDTVPGIVRSALSSNQCPFCGSHIPGRVA